MIAATLAAIAATLIVSATPAAAHGDDAGVQVIIDGRPEDGGFTYEVLIQYSNDNEPVEGAVVTLTGTDLTAPGDTSRNVQVPMPATNEAGHYSGTITLPTPGDWAVVIASAKPAARVERTLEVSPQEPPTSTASAPTTTTLAGEVTDPNGAVISSTSAVATSDGSAGSSDTDEGSMMWVWVAIGLAIVVVIAIGLATTGTSKRSSADTSDPT